MWSKISNYTLKLINQIFLFINVYTYVAWIISTTVFFYKQISADLWSYNFPLICFVVGGSVGGLRIYLGYSGNITENVRVYWTAKHDHQVNSEIIPPKLKVTNYLELISKFLILGSRFGWLDSCDVHWTSNLFVHAIRPLQPTWHHRAHHSNNSTCASTDRNRFELYYH